MIIVKRLILGLPEDADNYAESLHERGWLGISGPVAAPGLGPMNGLPREF
jgi:hypothetical protein